MPEKQVIENWFKQLQDSICSSLEQLEPSTRFQEDLWVRTAGGGGRTRVISNGSLIEKGGVNFSAVHGPTPEKILNKLGLEKADFYATGVSIVLHPENPWMPIIHMNVRYFEMSNGTYWFGGGIDLTPHYIKPEDGGFIHNELKKVCDIHHSSYYPRFKKWADDYFYLKHREETRGVGGIFFDRLNEQTEKLSFDEIWSFVKSVGNAFIPVYSYYVARYARKPYAEKEKNWQLLRRGRYVEFNLVWDSGTKFGLDTNGRTESILISMPPTSSWEYSHAPEAGSAESETLRWLKKDIDWLKYA